ncbi:MAG TPA: helix-turn-helix domain-containing protein [Burkholderiaceae bacterium]|nr:helix-turn-helix domain-containing protein [Burkholderiaceae bacterium]
MNLVFTTQDVPPAQRHRAWQEALCAFYVRVDSHCDAVDDYRGFVKESSFGTVTISDCLIAPQRIERRQSHLSRVDKDCFYVALTQKGHQVVEQRGRRLAYGPGSATIFSASDPYTLRNPDPHRAFYLEIPRAALMQRWQPSRPMVAATIHTTSGIGRIVADLCASMVLEADTLSDPTRAQLGDRLIDVLALALESPHGEASDLEPSIRSERLRHVRAYIERNVGDPLLSPERVAAACSMSVRALHYLFKGTGQSVSDCIWECRLQRCREALQMPAQRHRTVTEIALAAGFNSMSHFSSAFRRRFGVTPSDARDAAS